ncbi:MULTISPECIES: hypothetical protein [Streptomyces]|uniref:hypothetical protein n=1 Tax=Streptomyces TaxID=1883 RepID=UPI00167BA5D9|nr:MULTISPECIES: hypothetical protein [Streptomyces]MBK3524055.1 hypothetical protein [Streptomyces sp. MBT70]GGR81783.1 hypothetical protein GCM10010236_40580 [Streptomyces eurythermus]
MTERKTRGPKPAAVPEATLGTREHTGGPHTDSKGTNTNRRGTPGGNYVGTADQGGRAYWYRTASGPRVQCPGGTSTTARQLVRNKRTGVVGHVSACCL